MGKIQASKVKLWWKELLPRRGLQMGWICAQSSYLEWSGNDIHGLPTAAIVHNSSTLRGIHQLWRRSTEIILADQEIVFLKCLAVPVRSAHAEIKIPLSFTTPAHSRNTPVVEAFHRDILADQEIVFLKCLAVLVPVRSAHAESKFLLFAMGVWVTRVTFYVFGMHCIWLCECTGVASGLYGHVNANFCTVCECSLTSAVSCRSPVSTLSALQEGFENIQAQSPIITGAGLILENCVDHVHAWLTSTVSQTHMLSRSPR